MVIDVHGEVFGCEKCWPGSADLAWDAVGALAVDRELIDESHFKIKVRRCAVCSQRFVSVFTEQVDWIDGEDPQSWTLLPITLDEARDLGLPSAVLAALEGLGAGRRSLRHEYPKGENPRSFWGQGIFVGPHD